MANEAYAGGVGSVAEGRGLSQVERVVDTFVAPLKTFEDIRRNASWWLPFLLIAITFLGLARTVDTKVGFDQVYQNMLHSSPRMEDQMNGMEPAQRAKMMQGQTTGFKFSSYGFPVILLVILALYSLLLWAAFNFGLGAETEYKQVLAVAWYASLPYVITGLITILTVYFGNGGDHYDLKNPLGTNVGYYFPDASPVLKAVLSSIDVIKLWSVVLTAIGMAVLAKKTLMQSAVVVGSLWVLGVLLGTVGALFS